MISIVGVIEKQMTKTAKTAKTAAVAASALAAALTLAACSGSGGEQAAPSTTASVSASSSASPAAAPHNQSDVMFSMHMIPHHQQAIEMSDIILAKDGIDPRVVTLAKQIKAAQAPEIEQMKSWLDEWGMPDMPMMDGDEDDDSGGMPGMHGDMPGMDGDMPGMGGGGMGMSGMVSPQDIARLRDAQGVEASKLFLEQMIGHHEGAIEMAQNEIDNGENPDVIALCHNIIDTQQREIDEMKQILASL
ncbi:DUF305 domain-containing protein [Mycolicibacterium xanthum]|uniref:DUF305 domain-containing protein n=1 Tax=Mycolicibacterium xanthum TaxID=2796469 RepID=UPI002103B23A|nr:DUF305 domain-containing protein [Mycolicibacterium xanthum]